MSRSLTPAKVNTKHSQFLAHYFELGGRPEDGPEAAKRAGLATNDEDARRSAAILLGSDKIQKAIRDQVQKRFMSATNVAFETVLDLARNARNEATRLAAAKELLEKAGIVTVSRGALAVTVDHSAEALLDACERLQRGEHVEFSDDPIDADFSEVDQSTW